MHSILLAGLLLFPTPISGGAQTPEKQPVSVLYAGCPGTPREAAFLELLNASFARAEAIDLRTLDAKVAEPFDVVVADWKSRYRRVPGKDAEYDGSSGHSFALPSTFTKPVVMIGAVGGELASWSKIGWL